MNKQELIERIALQQPAVWLNDSYILGFNTMKGIAVDLASELDEPIEPQAEKVEARLAEHWHEDIGNVLWWNFPVEEPPYCGTPLDEHFPKYKTHFSMIDMPNEIEKPKRWVVKYLRHRCYYYFVEWANTDTFDPIGGPDLDYLKVAEFTDIKKAEAVATLVDGEVEEV